MLGGGAGAIFLFFFKQKTAYEITYGDWSSDVCSSDLVRDIKAAGLFDISHMGEVTVSGAEAEPFLNHMLTNDLRKLVPGQGQYTLMCHERGGVIDDLYAYRFGPQDYLLILNASRIDPDVAWLRRQVAAW